MLLGNDKVAGQFWGIRGLPTTFLVDRDGKSYSMHQGLVSRDIVEGELQTLLGEASLIASPEATAKGETTGDATLDSKILPN